MDKTGRRHRIHIPNTVHHVMVRGNNRQRIFYDHTCFERLIEIFSDSVKKFDHHFLCYCCMTNHAHLLIHIHNDQLSRVMQYINYRYARWVNHRYKKIGHVFQDRYRSLEVGNEVYLVNLCHYIHRNPLAAKMVRQLNDYPWSSHQYYVTQNAPSWLKIDWMQSVIKNKTQLNYVEFISQIPDRESWKPAMHVSDDGNIIFDEDVIHQFYLERTQPLVLKKNLLSEVVVAKIVCTHLEIDYQLLVGPSRERYLSGSRIVLANFWMIYSNLGIVEIAKRFHRTHGALSRQLVRFRSQKNRQCKSSMLEKIHAELDALR